MSCAAEVLPLCLSPREAGGVFFPSGVFFYLALREKGFVSLVSVMGGVLLRLLRYMVECQQQACWVSPLQVPVSYTHLTLPTKA